MQANPPSIAVVTEGPGRCRRPENLRSRRELIWSPSLPGSRPFSAAKRKHRLTPAVLLALLAHGVVLAWLAVVPLGTAPPAAVPLRLAPHFTFVGMAEDSGNPAAGGHLPAAALPPAAKLVESSPRTPVPPRTSTPIPPDRARPAPESLLPELVIAASVAQSDADQVWNRLNQHPLLIGPIPGSGSGDGQGAGQGDGSGNGVAGSGGTGTGGPAGSHPDYLQSPKPQYPPVARQQGWEGTAILRVEVRADGHTAAVKIVQSSGHRVLDEAAIEAVRAWKFQPARADGLATSAWVEVPISFRLNHG